MEPLLIKIIAQDKALFFSLKVLIFFLFLHENICCRYSLEAPQKGASNEYPQHMYSWRNMKKYNLDIPSYLEVWRWPLTLCLIMDHQHIMICVQHPGKLTKWNFHMYLKLISEILCRKRSFSMCEQHFIMFEQHFIMCEQHFIMSEQHFIRCEQHIPQCKHHFPICEQYFPKCEQYFPMWTVLSCVWTGSFSYVWTLFFFLKCKQHFPIGEQHSPMWEHFLRVNSISPCVNCKHSCRMAWVFAVYCIQ